MIKWAIISIYVLLINKIINNIIIYRKNNNYKFNNILKKLLFSNIIKRGYHNNSTVNNKLIIAQNKELIYKWLVGFTDGDGSFNCILSQNLNYRYYLQYHLHKDDIICIKSIINILGYSNNYELKNKSINLKIYNQQFIKNVILPIFDNYPLITLKNYSYILWRDNFYKYINKDYNNELIIKDKYLINNSKYLELLPKIINFEHITLEYIIGFIEAEGSFLLNNSKNCCNIYISQSNININTLIAIKLYILNNWKPDKNNIIPELIKNYLLKNWDNFIYLSKPNKDNVVNLLILDIDFLYYIIIPKFNSTNWYSIKYNSYINWQSIINIYIKGLHKINNNVIKDYIEDLKNLNKKGINIINYNSELYNSILNNNKSLYNVNYTYRLNSMLYSNNSNKSGIGVYVYDLNNKLVITFTGHRPASLYFNCSKHIIIKYIKNNDLFIDKYILKNHLINNTPEG